MEQKIETNKILYDCILDLTNLKTLKIIKESKAKIKSSSTSSNEILCSSESAARCIKGVGGALENELPKND